MKTFISITIGFVFFANLAVAQMTTFSQGDILSAGSMNQNFKHLQDQFAWNKKEIDCSTDNLTGTINDGYNHIVINGNCSISGLLTGGLDASRYCVLDFEHNPIQFLKIEGKTGKSNDSITIGNTGTCGQVLGTAGGYLELSNMTINTSNIGSNNGGTLRILDSTIDAENDADSNEISANKALMLMENVTMEHHLYFSQAATGDLQNISNASNKDIQGQENSFMRLDNVTARKIDATQGTVVDLRNSTINCSGTFQPCFTVQSSSYLSIEESTLTFDDSLAGIVVGSLTEVSLNAVTINSNSTSATISVNGPYAYLHTKNTTVPGTVACGNNVVAWSNTDMQSICE